MVVAVFYGSMTYAMIHKLANSQPPYNMHSLRELRTTHRIALSFL
jgi:hypothetical protein